METNKESNIHEAVLKISIAIIKEEFKKEKEKRFRKEIINAYKMGWM